MHSRLLKATLTLLGVPVTLWAQPGAGAPLEIGRTHQIQSRVLKETRTIDVTLPRRYEANTDRYPVLFVLDGESEHEIAAAISRFYAGSVQTPPLIVVGIRNSNRMRDMAPAAAPGFQVPPEARESGGADNFLRFLGDELIPWVDSTFRTAPMRVLIGHSLGGLFAVYTITKRPALFTGYIAMEPSTWWNDERELEQATAMLARPEARRVRLMLVNTRRIGVDTTQWGGVAPMVRYLNVTDETHGSMAAAGMLYALRTMFADFKPATWKPGTRPIAMLERYDSLSARVGYDVPIPASAFERVARMSAHGRYFDDAERVIQRWERTLGKSASLEGMRELLASERDPALAKGFIPLVIPARRPSPRDAAKFIGRWVSTDGEHELDVRASGDTIVVHDRIKFPGGEWDGGDHHVIQVTGDGTLEWGLPWFRNIPALVVLMAKVQPDGTLRVTQEPRGWVPRGPAGGRNRVTIFRRRSI